jgi:hypothetical protein
MILPYLLNFMADKNPNLMTEMLEEAHNSTIGGLMTSIESV